MVATRFGLVCVLTVYRSGRAVSVPSASTDMSRRWSGPNECSTKSVPLAGTAVEALDYRPVFASAGLISGAMLLPVRGYIVDWVKEPAS
jgi:hypothetical protein